MAVLTLVHIEVVGEAMDMVGEVMDMVGEKNKGSDGGGAHDGAGRGCFCCFCCCCCCCCCC